MKLRLICVGKLTEAWQRTAAADYAGRIQRYFPLDIVELKEEKGDEKGIQKDYSRGKGQGL